MPAPYDMAFRGRAVAAYEAGEGGYHELAAVFGVGYRTLQRWVARYRATESVAPKPRGGGWRSPIVIVVLHRVVRERPDGTSDEALSGVQPAGGTCGEHVGGELSPRADPRGVVVNKNGGIRVNATDPTFSGNAWRSSGGSSGSIRGGGSPSMRRA